MSGPKRVKIKVNEGGSTTVEKPKDKPKKEAE